MLSPGPVRCSDSSCYHSTCLLTYAGHWQDRAGGGGWAGDTGREGGEVGGRLHSAAAVLLTNATKTVSHVRHCGQGSRH